MVIALTDEPRGLVDKFVTETGAKHPIVIESQNSDEAFGVGGYPTIYLIGADGKIISGKGIPNDAMIEDALKSVRVPPKLTPKLAPQQKLMDARKYGEARAALAKAVETLTDLDKDQAQAVIAWIDENAAKSLEQANAYAGKAADGATADASKADPVEAAAIYREIAEQYKGLEAANTAAAGLKDLLADPAKKKEVDAADGWEKLQDRIAELKPKKAVPLLKAFLNAHKGTKAAEAAQKVYNRLSTMD
jgi:hypothetical protein